MTASTRSLWPEDLQTQDVRTPAEILSEQAQLLEQQTNGLLEGSIVEQVLEDRKVTAFEVSAPRIPETVRLFEVYQSLDLEYPVAIMPPNINIPDFLKREFYRPGPKEIMKVMSEVATLSSNLWSRTGTWEKNDWVADSPSEFTKILEKLLSSGGVKAILYKLLARSNRTNGELGQRESAG